MKHGVSFPDAEAVLFDPHGVTREDDSADGEQRFATLGLDALGACWWSCRRIVATPSGSFLPEKPPAMR